MAESEPVVYFTNMAQYLNTGMLFEYYYLCNLYSKLAFLKISNIYSNWNASVMVYLYIWAAISFVFYDVCSFLW